MRTSATRVGLAVAAAIFAVSSTASAEGLAGSAGTDTSLPPTDSAMTLPGRSQFTDLRVTVNQTKGLTNQAVSVTWTGGRPSTNFDQSFVQIFQCWGDDDGTNPDNPGPPPEQCEQGGQPFAGSVRGRIPSGTNVSNLYTRILATTAWSNYATEKSAPRDESRGHLAPSEDTESGVLWRPFRSVGGEVIQQQLKRTKTQSGEPAEEWQNPYFAFATTNEDNWQKTYGDGKGAALFQTFTGLEAPGLGCGQAVQELADGTKKIPKCWLVVVPRGTADEENPENVEFAYVATSPLTSTAWPNRISFPLEFNPIDTGCEFADDQRRIVGGDLAARAVINWQPTLCAGEGAKPFAFNVTGDEQARRQILGGAAGSAGLGVVTRPIDPAATDPDNPVTYAPITLSGAVIGFNIERRPFDENGVVQEPEEEKIAGVRISHINLTPRLVAKLLTQSYPRQFPNLVQSRPPENYEWITDNAAALHTDKDFVRFNPEFSVISVGTAAAMGGPVLFGGLSDVAGEVWRWVLVDPEAKKWLDGTPDEWGTRVNPLFSTNASVNPSGVAFAEPLPDTFPRNDPYCYQGPEDAFGLTPRPLCMLDASPLASNLEQAAQATRAAFDRRTTSHDPQNASQQTSSTYWGVDGPHPAGGRSILSITDSASAARFGLQTASLSRAGDNGDDRRFIAPDGPGFLEGVKAMKAAPDTPVLLPDPGASAPGAYPLTLLTYAASTPRSLDESSKADYSRFVTYAAGPGQTPGLKFGDLPPGYVPLPAELAEQSKAAAQAIATAKPIEENAGEEEEPAAATESERAADVAAEPQLTLDTPLESFTMPALLADLSVPVPASSPPPAVSLLSPLRALGKTPAFVAGAIRFAVPFLFVIGGLALLLFLIFDTSRLRALVSMRDGGPVRRPR